MLFVMPIGLTLSGGFVGWMAGAATETAKDHNWTFGGWLRGLVTVAFILAIYGGFWQACVEK